jgi:Zn-dependent peptidase ImmA (M78 family)
MSLEIGGETKTLAEWCRFYGISKQTINYRKNCLKLPVEKWFIPLNQRLSIASKKREEDKRRRRAES